jgi:hypothetical protein
MSLLELSAGVTASQGVALQLLRMPVLNGLAFYILKLLDEDNQIDIDDHHYPEIAAGIIGIKFLHTISAELLRLYVAVTDLGYIGDLLSAPTIDNAITNLDTHFFGKIFNALFFLPFLNQSYKRE